MDTKKRLVYAFSEVYDLGSGWSEEDLTEGGQIQDFAGLIAHGVAMRYSKEEILAALRTAIEELEAA